MSITAENTLPATDPAALKLATASKHVKIVFDVFAWLVIIATALIVIVLFVAAGAEHDSYINDFDNYTDESGLYVVAAFLTPVYGAFLWASLKLYAIVAGYIGWRTK